MTEKDRLEVAESMRRVDALANPQRVRAVSYEGHPRTILLGEGLAPQESYAVYNDPARFFIEVYCYGAARDKYCIAMQDVRAGKGFHFEGYSWDDAVAVFYKLVDQFKKAGRVGILTE